MLNLANVLYNWANVNCYKWTNIENMILRSGHTAANESH